MKKRHRIFIAINLPGDIKKFLSGYKKKWPKLPAKWTSAENLHITLVFLGDLTDTELGEVCMAVKEVTEKHNSLDIRLNRIGYGPDDKTLRHGSRQEARLASKEAAGQVPRFIWANGDKSKELSLLKKDLQDSLLQKVNFIPELRMFSPHVTLARISTFAWRQIEPEERPEINENIDLNFSVDSIEVMESELKKGQDARASHKMGAPVSGPQYTIIEYHQLS